MVLYVEYDAASQAYVAICENDRVVMLNATCFAAAESEADLLEDEGILQDDY
jgi:hypothetical protein